MPLFFKPCLKLRFKKKKKPKVFETFHETINIVESELSIASRTTLNDIHVDDSESVNSTLKSPIGGHPESPNAKLKDLCSDSDIDIKLLESCSSDQNNLISISSSEHDRDFLSNVRTLLSYTMLSSPEDSVESEELTSNVSGEHLLKFKTKSVQKCKASPNIFSESSKDVYPTTDSPNESTCLKTSSGTDMSAIEIVPIETDKYQEENSFQTLCDAESVCGDSSSEEQDKFDMISERSSNAEISDILRVNDGSKEVITTNIWVDICSEENIHTDTNTEKNIDEIEILDDCLVEEKFENEETAEVVLLDSEIIDDSSPDIKSTICENTASPIHTTDSTNTFSFDSELSETETNIHLGDIHVSNIDQEECAEEIEDETIILGYKNEDVMIECEIGNEDVMMDCEIGNEDDIMICENENSSEMLTELVYPDNQSPERTNVIADKCENPDIGLIDIEDNQNTSESQLQDILSGIPDCFGDFAMSDTDTSTTKGTNLRLAAKFEKSWTQIPLDLSKNCDSNVSNVPTEVVTLPSATDEETDRVFNLEQQSINIHLISTIAQPLVGDLLKAKLQEEKKSKVEDLASNLACSGDYVIPLSPIVKGTSCRLAARLDNNATEPSQDLPNVRSSSNVRNVSATKPTTAHDNYKHLNRIKRSRNLLLSNLRCLMSSPDPKKSLEPSKQSGNVNSESVSPSTQRTPNKSELLSIYSDSVVPYDPSKRSLCQDFLGLDLTSKNISEACMKTVDLQKYQSIEEKNHFEFENLSILDPDIISKNKEPYMQLIPSFRKLQEETLSLDKYEKNKGTVSNVVIVKPKMLLIDQNAIRTQIRRIIANAVSFLEKKNSEELKLSDKRLHKLKKLHKNIQYHSKLYESNLEHFENVSKNSMKGNFLYIDGISEQKTFNQARYFDEEKPKLSFMKLDENLSQTNSQRLHTHFLGQGKNLEMLNRAQITFAPNDSCNAKHFAEVYEVQSLDPYSNQELSLCEFEITEKAIASNYDLPNISRDTSDSERFSYDCPSVRPSERGDIGVSGSEDESCLSSENNSAYGDSPTGKRSLIHCGIPSSDVKILPTDVKTSTTCAKPQVVSGKDKKSKVTIHLDPRKAEITVKCRGDLEIVPDSSIQSASVTSYESLSVIRPTECLNDNLSNKKVHDTKQQRPYDKPEKNNERRHTYVIDEKSIENARLQNLELFNIHKAEAMNPLKQPMRIIPLSKLKGFGFKPEKFTTQLIKSWKSRKNSVDGKMTSFTFPSLVLTNQELSSSQKIGETPPKFFDLNQEKEYIFSPKSSINRTPLRKGIMKTPGKANSGKSFQPSSSSACPISQKNCTSPRKESFQHSSSSAFPASQKNSTSPRKESFQHLITASKNSGDSGTSNHHIEEHTPEDDNSPSTSNPITSARPSTPDLNRTFDKKFRNYAKKGRNTGDLINYKKSSEWLRDAGIVGIVLTEEEADKTFKNIAGVKVALNKSDYRRYLMKLARLKKLNYKLLYAKLCEHSGE